MGIVQGVTELFPVSSLGHGVLVPALFGWHNLVSTQTANQNFFLVFLIGLHVGTALGLVVYYRRTWCELFRGFGVQLGRTREEGVSSLWHLNEPTIDQKYRLLALLAIGSIPVGIVGIVLQNKFRELFAKPLAAAIFLTINGLILLGGEAIRRGRGRHASVAKLDTMTPKSAVAVGERPDPRAARGYFESGVAPWSPDCSTASIIEDAANFAFLLATPVILLAGLYKLPELFPVPLGHGVRVQTLVGALFAMGTAYLAVRFLTRWFESRTLRPFAIYCLVAGLLCVVRFA